MPDEMIVVRGTERELADFRTALLGMLADQKVKPKQLPVSEPAPVPRRMTDRAPLGHEPFLEIAIEIGKAVAVGVITGVVKDLVVAWIKEQAARRGLKAETKGG